MLQGQTSVISAREKKRHRKGDPIIIERQIFFNGMVYMIEEEQYSDPDHSSVYTSDDDFESDEGLQADYAV